MISFVDYFLDRITMYRLVLYVLIALVAISFLLATVRILAFSPSAIIFSTLSLLAVCLITNKLFALVFKVPANVESVYISGLILALIITPTLSLQNLLFLVVAGFLAMASKYIFAINKRHIFNPAAIALVITSFTINQSASWWIGTASLAPFVFILGLLVIRKVQREYLSLIFFAVSFSTVLFFSFFQGQDFFIIIQKILLDSPILFFAFIMLIEPLTTPTTRNLQIAYAALVGLLFSSQIQIGSFHFTPELALVVGNIFFYVVNPNYKFVLPLKWKKRLTINIYTLAFNKNKNFNFNAGQYMEWTLPHKSTDARGNRRYFSISSSPTEKDITITVKFYNPSSSFKKELINLSKPRKIIASQLAGDFVLPKNLKVPLVFIAGGVGITPFRSMIKYIIDKNLQTDIILIYSNRTKDEILFSDTFEKASKNGVRTVYCLTDTNNIPKDWQGQTGHITKQTIKKEVPDYDKRTFYISGPQLMVQNFEKILRGTGVKKSKIKTDFFPGYTEI